MYRVDLKKKTLIELQPTNLTEHGLMERFDLQEWVEKTPAILGEDLLFIAKELNLSLGARLDLLAVDKSGALVVVELKRDDTGGNVEWQAIRYASCCSSLLKEEIIETYAKYLNSSPEDAESRICEFMAESIENLNVEQRIILCARRFHSDVASAVLWLRDFNVDITCVRIMPYRDDSGTLFLHPDIIIPLPEAKDYIERKEHKKSQEKDTRPWSRYLYVNVGENQDRNWDDNARFGYMSAGGGPNWSNQIRRLKPGDLIFAYLKGRGYVGFGEVVSEAVPVDQFVVSGTGKGLDRASLAEPGAFHDVGDPDRCEYLAGVRWIKTFKRDEGKYFPGIFSHPSVVARMRQGETIEFLEESFGIVNSEEQ